MEKQAGGLSDTYPGDDNTHHASAGSREKSNGFDGSACQSSCSEDVHSLDSLKAPGDSEDCQMPEDVNTSNEAVTAAEDISGSSDPNETISCRGDPDGALPAKFQGLPSACRIKQGEANTIDSLNLKIDERNHVTLDHKAGIDDRNSFASNSSDAAAGKECMKSNPTITNIQNTEEHPLQDQAVTDNDGSDDLVDVRLCDICGDVGREALLALCSKCHDGAEHIYCMRTKLEEVPEGDWMCEDCLLKQEPKIQKQAGLERSNSASKLSHSKELRTNYGGKASVLSCKRRCSDMEVGHASKKRILERSVQPSKSSGSGEKPQTQVSSPKVACFGDQSSKKAVEKVNLPSVQRSLKPRSDIAMGPSLKKRTFERKAQPLKSGGSRVDLLTRISPLKTRDKGNDASRRSSLFGDQSANKVVKRISSPPGHRSPKLQQQVCGGDLSKRKLVNISNSAKEVQGLHGGTHHLKKTIPEKKPTEKKMFKSLSFSGASSAPRHLSKALTSNVKEPEHESGRNLSKNNGSAERSPRLGLPIAGSVAMKVDPSRTKVSSEIGNVPEMKDIQVDENSNSEALASLTHQGQNYVNASAGTPENQARDVNFYPDRTPIQPSQKADPVCYPGHVLSSTKDLLVNLHPINIPQADAAVPESECIWKGAFELEEGGKLPSYCSGLQAHLSTCASSKVLELVQNFHARLLFKEVPRLDSWPIQFQRNHPTEKDVAVYFFAEDLQSYLRIYKTLLEGMIKNDVALEANFDGVQFLVFPSSLLPMRSQRWNALSFLWGVFRVRKVDDPRIHISSVNVATSNRGFCFPIIYGTQNKLLSVSEARSVSGSYTSHNSLQGPESANLVAVQSSASTKSMDQNFEHEVSSVNKCRASQGEISSKADTLPAAASHAEKEMFSGGVLYRDDFQKDGYTNHDMKILSKSYTFPISRIDKENVVSPITVMDGNDKISSFPWDCDAATKLWQDLKLDVTNRISFSVDSGPSGSSDGAGCAKSDEGQVEQLQLLDPAHCGPPNLDLCLGCGGSEPDGREVDLDLGLGFLGQNPRTKDGGDNDRSVSLALSLGMPSN